MQDTVIFNGPNALDFYDVRLNVIRIPEVVMRLRKAQEIWDSGDYPDFDLTSFMASDDKIFLSNLKSKSLCAAIVQLGLYDRYIKQSKEPRFLVGNSNGDSAMKVAAGLMTFEELVLSSSASKVNRAGMALHLTDAPLLAGVSLTEYGVLENKYIEGDSSFASFNTLKNMDVTKIVESLIEDHGVKKIVNIGPGGILLQHSIGELSLRDVQILESVDLDPLLSWFWPSLKDNQLVG